HTDSDGAEHGSAQPRRAVLAIHGVAALSIRGIAPHETPPISGKVRASPGDCGFPGRGPGKQYRFSSTFINAGVTVHEGLR
ncbi:hypothetical protein, partial [Cronobacter sakazakii]|uniref:hypothetical protein n=1 Tax=Cronobacter sakazakii TaxID=28141 RepID=UPI001A7EDBCF